MRLSRPPKKEVLKIDFPNCLAKDFPEVFPAAWEAAGALCEAIRGSDFSALERHSPGLKGFDWVSYLRCSVARVVRTLRALSANTAKPARVLDFGAYFGNFALAARDQGYSVDAVDFYNAYQGAFAGAVELMRERKVGVLDFDELGANLERIPDCTYDAVLCMGVIEHIPHTPKFMLQTLDRVLKTGGILVLDTPNLAYIYKRRQLMRGESVYPPIHVQFNTEIPFAGHHREYTVTELRWMIEQLVHRAISIDTFSYSFYSLAVLQNEDLENYRLMENDPGSRELILTVSQKVTREMKDPKQGPGA